MIRDITYLRASHSYSVIPACPESRLPTSILGSSATAEDGSGSDNK
jgi:hypothetical protein